MKALDLSGQRFGKLTVTEKIGRKYKARAIYWRCICDCGNTSEVRAAHLTSGLIVSCGCHKASASAARHTTHGYSRLIDGKRAKEYRSWQSMLDRCFNDKVVNWHRYGGRGITVCQQWQESFEQFLADMGPCPEGCTLDRINNELDYGPENCRWATPTAQARNRRNNVIVHWQGREMVLAELAEITGVPYKTLHRRIKILGWSVDDAVSKPSRSRQA